MATPRVFVTRMLPRPAIDILSEHCDVELRRVDTPATREELLEGVSDKDAILCSPPDRIDSEVMDTSGRLRVVSTFTVGYDHIDVEAATTRGIYVTNTPGVLTESVADFVWTLLLGAARHLVVADRYLRNGRWKTAFSPTLFLGVEVYGKTLGIVGLGRIGSAIARRARGFGMKVLYHNRRRLPVGQERDLRVQYATLEDLLRTSDFVTLNVPLTGETRHMIDESRFKLMKPTAVLVNASRGPVVDERALIKALTERWITGAALDVYEREPIGEDHPLVGLDNVVLAPHLASATKEARSRMSEVSARNILAVLRGEPPISLVNPEVQSKRPLSEIKLI